MQDFWRSVYLHNETLFALMKNVSISRGLESVIRRMKSWEFIGIFSVYFFYFFYKYMYKMCDMSHDIE